MLTGIAKLLKDFQKIQGEIKKLQGELSKQVVTGSGGGGMVEVTANGRFEVIDIKIEKKLIQGRDVQMLEDLIVAAVNDAMKKAQGLIKDKIGQFTGGLSIPEMGIPGMFGE
ncbi:YbaB/EbfC family nucleoid-associated protein [Patescibacteria group bacterium]|nr:YbaB/EbfC family nucleoid-associated protein [Patescibacteria group bacterium]